MQLKHPEAHISCAGRGRADQEKAYDEGRSRALFGQSAHNFNAAIDVFEQGGDSFQDIFERNFFDDVIAANLENWLEWYGEPGHSFPELPHIEVAKWKEKNLQPVEPL